MLDFIIANGRVYDGTGKVPFKSDIGLKDGKITAIGNLSHLKAKEIIDADGLIVTPGWIDIHSHYDAQIVWDKDLSLSSLNGATTIIIGNCGLGVAPCKKSDASRKALLQTNARLLDIPTDTLLNNIEWQWETFDEYLEYIDHSKKRMNVMAYIPHAALRHYFMEDPYKKAASDDEILQMRNALARGLASGAVGFSTSQTLIHKDGSGKLQPGSFCSKLELESFASLLNKRFFEIILDAPIKDSQLEWMADISTKNNCIVSFNFDCHNFDEACTIKILEQIEKFNALGAKIKPQILPRPPTYMMSKYASDHLFYSSELYRSLMQLSADERISQLLLVENKKIIIEQTKKNLPGNFSMKSLYRYKNVNSYEPDLHESFYHEAETLNRDPIDYYYDLIFLSEHPHCLLAGLGHKAELSLNKIYRLLKSNATLIGFTDGGAHTSTLCETSAFTFLLQFWTKERQKGNTLLLESAISLITSRPAEAIGLTDRGIIAVGMKADINILDGDNLKVLTPEVEENWLGITPRVVQRSEGYRYTFVNGAIMARDGKFTAAYPGQLLRSY